MAVTNIRAYAVKIAAWWFAALSVGGTAEARTAFLVRVTTLRGVFRLATCEIEAETVIGSDGVGVDRRAIIVRRALLSIEAVTIFAIVDWARRCNVPTLQEVGFRWCVLRR